RPAHRRRPARGAPPHRRPVGLRRRHPRQPGHLGAGSGRPLRPVLGPVPARRPDPVGEPRHRAGGGGGCVPGSGVGHHRARPAAHPPPLAGRAAYLVPGAWRERVKFEREAALARLADETFDVLVVGGGVTGAGVALDAASRGLHTALVERDDFASGTSSKSSKMVHGGLRYLNQRDYRLVYEALHERQRLLHNAPHLVKPLPFLIPLYGGKAIAKALNSALWIYDLTGGLRIGKRHRRISVDDTLGHMPTLRREGLAAGFEYYDAQADDARLTLTIARTAVLDHGAVAANYAGVTGLLKDARGKVTGARVGDLEVRS